MLRTRTAKRDTASAAIRRLEKFRREGHDAQRFKVGMGAQSEKRGKYPYAQVLRITILDDEPRSKKRKDAKGSRRG